MGLWMIDGFESSKLFTSVYIYNYIYIYIYLYQIYYDTIDAYIYIIYINVPPALKVSKHPAHRNAMSLQALPRGRTLGRAGSERVRAAGRGREGSCEMRRVRKSD